MDIEKLNDRIPDYCDNIEVHTAVLKTVSRLPEDVQEYACGRCVFLALADYGMVLPGLITYPHSSESVEMIEQAPKGASRLELADYVETYERKAKWIILLPRCLAADEAQSIIAHEIAHAFLGHDRLSICDFIDVETEACNLVRSWGFGGLGADVEYCTAPYR